MTSPIKKNIRATLLFASFMLLQFAVLRMGNQAGRGYLADDLQEKVYLFLQIFVIAGFVLYALTAKLTDKTRAAAVPALCALGVCLAGAGIMQFAPSASAFYLAVTGLTVFCLGFTGGKVYHRMALFAGSGVRVGFGMGIGYATAVALQYVLQLRFDLYFLKYVLAVFLLAAVAALAFLFIGAPEGAAAPKEAQSEANGEKREAPENEYSGEAPEAGIRGKTPEAGNRGEAFKNENRGALARKIIFACVITAAMLLFTGYYNTYIHHLQIVSGYAEYSVYTWPRLLLIPGMIAFGAVGEIKKGKLLPVCALCVSVLALLNAVLAGVTGAYWLNMCLYYVALSSAVAYYNMVFWRLAPKTARPALWASAGRIFDSAVVLPSMLFGISGFSSPAVLSLNIAALAVIIVLMALNGDFNLVDQPAKPQPAPASAPSDGSDAFAADADRAQTAAGPASPEVDPFRLIQERYALTPTELKVFRELVLTEDKQTAIGERLSIKVRTVQANVTSIYRKTGVSTRSGLVQLYHDHL